MQPEITLDQAIDALNESVHRSSFKTPYYYDLYVQDHWAGGSVHADAHGQGRLSFGLRTGQGVDPMLFQELGKQIELYVYDDANESGEPVAQSNFTVESLGQTHVMETAFTLPEACKAYSCEIRRKA